MSNSVTLYDLKNKLIAFTQKTDIVASVTEVAAAADDRLDNNQYNECMNFRIGMGETIYSHEKWESVRTC